MRRDLVALVLVVLAHCALFENGLGGSDGWGYFANVESLVEDHDLDLANNLSPKGKEGIPGQVGTAEGQLGGMPHPSIPGRVINSYPLGKAVADLPFYLLGKGAGALLKGVRFPAMKGTPYEGMPPRRMVCALALVFGSNLYAAAAVAVTFLALIRLGFPRPAAWVASLLAFFASPLPFYATNAMSHAASTLVSALILWHWAGHPQRVFVLGVLAGAAFSLRYAGAALVPCLALLLLFQGPGAWRRLLFFGLGVACLAWIEPVRNGMELGSPFRTLYPPLSESLVWRCAHLPWVDYVPVLNLFAATRHGILWWSPLVGVAMGGLMRSGGDPRIGQALRMAWVLVLGQAVLAGIGGSYHAGSGFSQRYLCESMPCWALGLALLIRSARSLRATLGWFTLLAAWNYLLFLLTDAHLARVAVETGTREGWQLTDYLYVFDAHLGLREILGAILAKTVPGQLAGPRVAALSCLLAGGLLGIALWRLRRAQEPGESLQQRRQMG